MRHTLTPSRYTLDLSADETRRWASRPGAHWPCSSFAGHAIRAEFDSGGLADLVCDVDGPADEFNALTADAARHVIPRGHALYFVTVGQFPSAEAPTWLDVANELQRLQALRPVAFGRWEVREESRYSWEGWALFAGLGFSGAFTPDAALRHIYRASRPAEIAPAWAAYGPRAERAAAC